MNRWLVMIFALSTTACAAPHTAPSVASTPKPSEEAASPPTYLTAPESVLQPGGLEDRHSVTEYHSNINADDNLLTHSDDEEALSRLPNKKEK